VAIPRARQWAPGLRRATLHRDGAVRSPVRPPPAREEAQAEADTRERAEHICDRDDVREGRGDHDLPPFRNALLARRRST
jgi:hypothetical protein